jgi:predicted DNA binding CopG/RHH family protein
MMANTPSTLNFDWDDAHVLHLTRHTPRKGKHSIVPRKKLAIPSFQNEKEEAAWWEKHRASVEADLRHAMREHKTLSLNDVLAQAKRKKELQPVTIRLASEDIATARQLADDKGIGYQTYIKLLLHEALRREAARQSAGQRK